MGPGTVCVYVCVCVCVCARACTHMHTGGGGAHLLPWTPQSMLHLGRLLAVLSVTEFSVHGHVSLSDPHGVPGNRGGGSSAARLEAGGRQSQGAGALRVPSRTRSLCAFSGPPGGQCRPLPPRSGSRRAAGPAPRPHAAAPSPAPPLASHSECGQIPSAFPAPSPAFPRASGGLLITSAGSLSLIPAPTGAATCHRLYWSQLPGGERSIEDWGSVEASVNVEGGHSEIGDSASD